MSDSRTSGFTPHWCMWYSFSCLQFCEWMCTNSGTAGVVTSWRNKPCMLDQQATMRRPAGYGKQAGSATAASQTEAVKDTGRLNRSPHPQPNGPSWNSSTSPLLF